MCGIIEMAKWAVNDAFENENPDQYERAKALALISIAEALQAMTTKTLAEREATARGPLMGFRCAKCKAVMSSTYNFSGLAHDDCEKSAGYWVLV